MSRIPPFFPFVTVIAAIVVAAMSFSCSKSGTDSVDQDNETFPSSVVDLRVTAVTPTTVTLKWTAPGDNDTIGTAAEYDLRFSKKEITWQNWDSASLVSGEPAPKPRGTTDSMVVTGLMVDSTYYFAIKTRSKANTWSWLSNCVSAMCFNDVEVGFPDPHLNAVVRAAIGKPTGAILRSELLPLEVVASNNDSVASLEGLQYCVNLRVLYLWHNYVSDLTPLADLKQITNIQLAENSVSDLSPLADLTGMRQLILNHNSISDISALANMTLLNDVNLSTNSITSISALSGCNVITMLALGENSISDITPLSGMVHLTSLELMSNRITNVEALNGMTKLTYLGLYDNLVADIAPLAPLTSLERLNLWGNEIGSVAALSGMTKLTELYLIDNHITDISVLSGLTALQKLYLSDNMVADLTPLAGLTALVDFQIQRCQVVDVTPLQNLINLQKLVLIGNQIVDIAPLVANTGLGTGDLLYISGNPLSQESINTYVPVLRDRGVTLDI